MTTNKIVKAIFLTVIFIGTLAGGVYAQGLSPVNAANIQTYSIQADGKPRTYTVYVPSSYSNKKPAPVVVMLHGAGGTGEGVIRETAWDQKADQEGFLVVFPNAMRINQESDPSFLTNPQMWNDGSNRGLGLLSDTNDVKYLSLVLDDLAKAYAIDQKAIFITGFSSGASMLFRAADEMPGRFAAIAPVSGHYWPPSTPPINQSPIPTILIVGTADPINPFVGGVISLPWGSFEQPPFMNTILSWAKRNGLPQGLSATAGKPGVKSLHAVGENPDWFRVYIVEGLGHMWPGGEAIFPESFIGKDPGTLQATEIIWQYFSQVRARSR